MIGAINLTRHMRMDSKKLIIFACMLLNLIIFTTTTAQSNNTGPGQSIQITTRLTSFVGRPSWLLVIRDIDSNQNLPYIFNFTENDNFWLAFTVGRNYFVMASTLQFSPYKRDPYRSKRIDNFCQLESNGRVLRGESIFVTLTGKLTPNTDTYQCTVSRYNDANFTVTDKPNSS